MRWRVPDGWSIVRIATGRGPPVTMRAGAGDIFSAIAAHLADRSCLTSGV